MEIVSVDMCLAEQPCPALATIIRSKDSLKRNKEILYTEAN